MISLAAINKHLNEEDVEFRSLFQCHQFLWPDKTQTDIEHASGPRYLSVIEIFFAYLSHSSIPPFTTSPKDNSISTNFLYFGLWIYPERIKNGNLSVMNLLGINLLNRCILPTIRLTTVKTLAKLSSDFLIITNNNRAQFRFVDWPLLPESNDNYSASRNLNKLHISHSLTDTINLLKLP